MFCGCRSWKRCHSPTTPRRDTAMRTVIVTEFISLDGVIEAPGGEEGYRHTGWTFDIAEDPTMYEFKREEAPRRRGAPPRPAYLRGLRRGVAGA